MRMDRLARFTTLYLLALLGLGCLISCEEAVAPGSIVNTGEHGAADPQEIERGVLIGITSQDRAYLARLGPPFFNYTARDDGTFEAVSKNESGEQVYRISGTMISGQGGRYIIDCVVDTSCPIRLEVPDMTDVKSESAFSSENVLMLEAGTHEVRLEGVFEYEREYP